MTPISHRLFLLRAYGDATIALHFLANSPEKNNYTIIAQGGFGGGGSSISCGNNGSSGSPGYNGSIEYSANFNSSGFFVPIKLPLLDKI